MSVNETKPSADERVTAALAHGVVIAYGLGTVGAVVMWLLQKEKSELSVHHSIGSDGPTIPMGDGL